MEVYKDGSWWMEVLKFVRNGRMGWPFSATVNKRTTAPDAGSGAGNRREELASEPRPSSFTRSVISCARAECNCVWANSAIINWVWANSAIILL